MKAFADDNFKVDENRREFLRRAENTVGKKWIVTSNFALNCRSFFKRLLLQTRKNHGLFEKGLKYSYVEEKNGNRTSNKLTRHPGYKNSI